MGPSSQSAPRDGRPAQRKRILIIEDDKDIRGLLRYDLEREGFRVSESEDGLDGLALVRKSPPDLLVLDLMLPRLSGLEICKQVRREQTARRMPILVLTARSEEPDRIVGLELGADDYVTKPFSPRELVARIKALLRRSEPAGVSGGPLKIGPLVIDPSSYRVSRNGRALEVSALEFRLLHFLASHPNRAFTRDQLLEAVWGADRFVIPRIVDVYVRHLREKIEDEPNRPVRLKTVRSVGYLFDSNALLLLLPLLSLM
jgi:two-component system alkaline phosphatase synthesis response regulator PhoP